LKTRVSLHDRVGLEWVPAYELALEFLKSRHDGERLPLERRFADAIDAVIRVELDEDEIRTLDVGDEGLQAGDLHYC
jgi:hypothetical protein